LFLVTLVFLLMYHAPDAGATEAPGLIDGARKEASLMIYSLLAVPDHSRIVNRFKEKYPFVEVSLIRPGASERITTRVITEARTGQHLVDVIGVSRLNMLYLTQRALVMSYDSPERQYFDPRFKDKKGYWTAFYINPEVTIPVCYFRQRRRKIIKTFWIRAGKGTWYWNKRPLNGSLRSCSIGGKREDCPICAG
jgi:hypothetical protein